MNWAINNEGWFVSIKGSENLFTLFFVQVLGAYILIRDKSRRLRGGFAKNAL